MTAPFRRSGPWRAARHDLARQRLATLLALLGAVAAALALRLAGRGALAAAARLVADRPSEPLYAGGRAILILVSGLGSALLLAAVTRAVALCGYAGSDARAGLRRTPALLAVALLELVLDGTLALAGLLLAARHLHHYGTAAQEALRAVALLAPLLPPALAGFAAARVAQSLVARGLPLGLALVHGCDFTLRRFPSLARLALGGLWRTWPLLLLAALAPFPLGAALLAAAGLWSYAALIRLVGADPRLAGG